MKDGPRKLTPEELEQRARQRRDRKPVVMGCVVTVIVGILVALYFALSFISSMLSGPSKPAGQSQRVAEEKGGEVYVVSLCDTTIKDASIAKGSYDSGWKWEFQNLGSKRKVIRDFNASNAFGAKISGTYICQYDVPTDRVTTLWVDGPMGVTRVIG